MWEYTDKVRELFLNPKNVGEVENPDAVGEVGSIACGDALRLTLRIDRATDRILDARFQTFGCASAIASSSALTELIRGKTIEEARSVTNQEIANYLGGLPKEKMHCSVMGREALDAAIADYRGEKKPAETHDRIVCHCMEVTEEKIRKVIIENRLTTVEDVTYYTKAGGACGFCIPDIEAILREIGEKRDQAGKAIPILPMREKKPEGRGLTNLQRIALIQETIEREIRPRLQADGGDVELLDIDGNRVIIGLRAMCVACHMADVTIGTIEQKLRELVSPEIVVEAR